MVVDLINELLRISVNILLLIYNLSRISSFSHFLSLLPRLYLFFAFIFSSLNLYSFLISLFAPPPSLSFSSFFSFMSIYLSILLAIYLSTPLPQGWRVGEDPLAWNVLNNMSNILGFLPPGMNIHSKILFNSIIWKPFKFINFLPCPLLKPSLIKSSIFFISKFQLISKSTLNSHLAHPV